MDKPPPAPAPSNPRARQHQRPTRTSIAAAMRALDAAASALPHATEAEAETTTLLAMVTLLDECITAIREERPIEIDGILTRVGEPAAHEAHEVEVVRERVATLKGEMMALLDTLEPEADGTTNDTSVKGANTDPNAQPSHVPTPTTGPIITTNDSNATNATVNDVNAKAGPATDITHSPATVVISTSSPTLGDTSAVPPIPVGERLPIAPVTDRRPAARTTSRAREGDAPKTPPRDVVDADATLVNDVDDLDLDEDNFSNRARRVASRVKRKRDPDSDSSDSDGQSESHSDRANDYSSSGYDSEKYDSESDSSSSSSSSSLSSTSSRSTSSSTSGSPRSPTPTSPTLSLFSPDARRNVWHSRKLNKEIWQEFRGQAAPLGGSLLAARKGGVADEYKQMEASKKTLDDWLEYAEHLEEGTPEDIEDLATAILCAADCGLASTVGRQLWEDIRGSCRRSATGSRGSAARGVMARERRRAGVNAEDLYGCPDWRMKKDKTDKNRKEKSQMTMTVKSKKRKHSS